MTSEHGRAGAESEPTSNPTAKAPAARKRSVDAGSSAASPSSAPTAGAAMPGRVRPGAAASGRAIAAVMCPFLATESGAWRAAFPVGEHRCMAVVPAVRIAPAKQRRLCLTADHESCATYVAALELRGAAGGPNGQTRTSGPGRRAIPITTPVLLERIRPALPIPATMQRGAGQIVLVGLLAVAFVAVFFAKLGSAPGASPSPSVPAALLSASPSVLGPTASAVPSPSPSTSPSGSPGASPSPRPTAKPSPSGSARPASGTYTVKSGDTLSGIATRFGTTLKALRLLNGLSATSSTIHPGQVLKIP